MLFVIILIVLITDTCANLAQIIGDDISNISEILFADDILVVDEHGDLASQYMHCIRAEGSKYMGWISIGTSSST